MVGTILFICTNAKVTNFHQEATDRMQDRNILFIHQIKNKFRGRHIRLSYSTYLTSEQYSWKRNQHGKMPFIASQAYLLLLVQKLSIQTYKRVHKTVQPTNHPIPALTEVKNFTFDAHINKDHTLRCMSRKSIPACSVSFEPC